MRSKATKMLAIVLGLSTAMVGSAAFADPGHDRGGRQAGPSGYYPGPQGSRIPYMTGYYTNNRNRRTAYTYPQDYQQYGRPLNWYQGHSHWKESNHQDWYRGRGR